MAEAIFGTPRHLWFPGIYKTLLQMVLSPLRRTGSLDCTILT
jgi:hypothetical protein